MEFSQFQSEYHVPLDEQQLAAVQAANGPTLLLAVPGSGKTTTLVTRLAYLVLVQNVAPESILTMTYTVAAAQDMRARFAALFRADLAERLEFRTINGVCSRIIRYYERTKNRTAFPLLQDTGRQASLLRSICKKQTNEFISDSVIKAVQTEITYVKNAMLTDDELDELEIEGLDFPALYRTYVRVMRQHKWMDYDDQMIYAHQILRQYPDILAAFQNRYSYICVDEAQDTSRIQHVIIRLLAGRAKNLFMVGDEDQSIYGFRAACPEELTRFELCYPGAQVLLMEQNYRSTEEIVRAANRFIRLNQNRRPKQMHATRGSGAAVRQITVTDRRGQYLYLARVAALCETETAVLYRDNDSALPLIDLLERRGIPYRTKKMERLFFSHWIVRDITDIIHFSVAPDDGDIFLRIYYKFSVGISRAAAELAVKQCARSQQTILECLADMDGLSSWTKKQCKALQTHLNNMRTDRADRAVYRIVHFMGYGDYLENRNADSGKIDILTAIGAGEDSPLGLLRRLEELELLLEQDQSERDCNFILSTIHSSKGLEYERVFLMDIADGLFPKVAPPDDPQATPEEQDAYEEERRLFYVGMTRAKQELNIFCFRSPELFSSFTSFLFPQKVETAHKPEGSLLPLYEKKLSDAEIDALSKAFTVAAEVQHSVYGTGHIVERARDVATICFDDGSVRRLLLPAALRSGVIAVKQNK